MPYTIEFAECVKTHFRVLTASQRTLILDSIEKQLIHEPLTKTRNRKPLRPNPLAPWELRIGNLRVFYDVTSEDPKTVQILAVGIKRGNQLYIGGKLVKL